MTTNNNSLFEQQQYFIFTGKINYHFNEKHTISLTAQNLFDKKYVVFDPRVANGEVPGKGRELSVNYLYIF